MGGTRDEEAASSSDEGKGMAMKLEELLDIDNLTRRIAEGYVTERRSSGLRLWNYTAKAQYERVWDQETRRCRGLVATDDGFVISRPFEKFFNVGELPELPMEPFDVYEKLDGSLIVIANGPDGLVVTSRGSFDSEHAIIARRLWGERHFECQIPVGQTWCFELIAPWNRIVVNYGLREELVLLAAIDNPTGRDMPTPGTWNGTAVRRFDFTETAEVLAKLASLGPDEEGYVIRFRESSLRVKAKGDEYVRLHRLVTGCTSRMIWELLSTGQPLEPLLDRVPDGLSSWVRQTAGNLTQRFAEIRELARSRHDAICGLSTRKEQALSIAEFEHRSIVFRMLDAKPYDEVIWKALYPSAERPFKAVIENNA